MYGIMRPATVYEMHIFKDVNKTSWTNPQIHTFQLTESAASPFLTNRGSKDGLKNLRRCSPAQLSFLQSHLAGQNASLKSARDAEKEARKLRQKKEAQKAEEKRAEEVKKWQEKMEQRASKLKEDEDNENCGRIYGGGPDDSQRFTLPNIPSPPYRSAYPIHPHRSRDRDIIYSPPSFPVYPVHPASPPPPPPPPCYGVTPTRRQPVRENPPQQESDWCLESVEMDLVTVVTKPKVEKPKAASLGSGQRHRSHCRDYPRSVRSRGKLPVLGYQLADSANFEFAVIYSRTVMTSIPHVSERRAGSVYYANEYNEGSFYEYGSDQDTDFVSDEEVEVEEGDKDKEEEEDLEIVEGFKHCHPITESMSNCCLGK